MLKLDLSRDAGDFIAGLPGKQLKQVVSAMLSVLKKSQPDDARALSGLAGCYRVDSGEYRIVIRVEGELMRVPLIGMRNDADDNRRLGRKGG